MKKEMNAVEAKYEAQKIAFAPIFFQAVVALRDLGILNLISRKRGNISIGEISEELQIKEYGVRVLLEAAEAADVVVFKEDGNIALSKVGFFLLKDPLTQINFNFVNDVCYEGAKYTTESIKSGKPEGLKVFDDWETIYEGLSRLPGKAKKSWFDFDHYYSDNAFPSALEIVFREKPSYLFDIGGNTGKWAKACCNHDPDVKVKILDLPGQLEVAKENIKEAGFDDRVGFHPINLLKSEQKIPQGADAVWMSQFLDCFSEEEIVCILKNVCQAVDNDAFVYINETFIDNQEFEAAKYCLTGTSLYFTTMANGNSKMYSEPVMKELVKKAGLEIVEVFPLIGDSYHTILKCRKS